ncbi:MAG TPA: valine--tRNA ligase [Candidatus Acidoferrum sp.]|nr:valine--tRNA ligase [Candidatus Acidoferrum sp.]
MSEIPKAYEPQSVEDKWYDFWLKQNCFTADPARVSPKRPAYSIVIPPPNVTGMLTMGHVLNNTIQDILARKARMDGKEVLWLPGTDHAGIATQTVVEKTLKKAGEIKHRDDLGREKFLERVWAWKEKHGGIIIQQLKKLGASCDWTRERFTMDPEYSRCVQKVFVELYKKGLIYRGKRMVNWDPAAHTALSDEEVEMIEEKGHLWHIKYPFIDDQGKPKADEFVVVATTRPETMLGDEAVAVNPKDPRYTKLVGKKVLLPIQNKPIPIIADELVDPKFGTGCVKVTPSHDPADYEMAVRHKLPLTVVIGPDGRMTAVAGKDFERLDRMKARQLVIEKLTEQGLLVKIEDYVHNVGYSQRSHVPIEPYLSEQWFLKYPSVEKSRACVELGSAGASPAAVGAPADSSEDVANSSEPGKSGRLFAADEASAAAPGAGALPKMRFHPQRWAKVYDHWMGNIKDWCISRQLWWGHRIPVWRKVMKRNDPVMETIDLTVGHTIDKGGLVELSFAPKEGGVSYSRNEYKWIDDEHFELEIITDSPAEIKMLEDFGFTQDPDVLDTWFSSWLWPFATMGWTGDKSQDSNTPTLRAFYPTTDLVTGPDIIFFWVARMIMAGYEFMDDLPFHNVYFTGIIRDKQGRKMSKSLGNSPDPLDLIAKYGADALRFGTMRSAPLGQDILFDEQNVELGRNFCNKLWNACRFRQMMGSAPVSGASAGVPPAEIQGEIDPKLLTSDDKWILLKLDQAIRDITEAFAEYKFSDATATLYRFFWSEYCDWYVEASKAVLVKSVTELNMSNESGATPSNATHLTNRSFNDLTARKANTLAVIDFVLSHTLRLFHPFLPFITEELWHGMGYADDMPENQGGKTIMTAPWPKSLDDDFKGHYGLDDCYLDLAGAKYDLVTLGRNLRREFNIQANKKIKFVLKPAGNIPAHDVEVIKLLLNAEAVELDAGYAPPKGTPMVANSVGELYLPLAGLVDVAAEKARLTKEVAKCEAELEKVQSKLNNPNFAQKVPPNVLQEHQQRLAEWQAKLARAKAALAGLG